MSVNPPNIPNIPGASGPVSPGTERLMELLSIRAVEGLSEAEAAEVARLAKQHPEVDAHSLDRAAAAAFLAREGAPAMPGEVSDRIARRLDAEFGADAGEHRTAAPSTHAEPRVIRGPWWGTLGWVAAAACLALAAVGWWPRLFPTPPPTAAQLLAQMQRQDPAVRVITLTRQAAPEAGGLIAEVVWSDSQKRGFLRFRGVAGALKSGTQFQAWVFDNKQVKPDVPVSGGTFEVPAGTIASEYVVALDPALPIGEPGAFGVTVERLGGVVLPTMENLAFVGK